MSVPGVSNPCNGRVRAMKNSFGGVSEAKHRFDSRAECEEAKSGPVLQALDGKRIVEWGSPSPGLPSKPHESQKSQFISTTSFTTRRRIPFNISCKCVIKKSVAETAYAVYAAVVSFIRQNNPSRQKNPIHLEGPARDKKRSKGAQEYS